MSQICQFCGGDLFDLCQNPNKEKNCPFRFRVIKEEGENGRNVTETVLQHEQKSMSEKKLKSDKSISSTIYDPGVRD